MSEQPKIGVLCNSTLGIPSLHVLLSNNLIAALGLPEKVHDATNDIKDMAASFQQEVTLFKKQNLQNELIDWVKAFKLNIVLVFTFPWKIGTEVLGLPELGFINFHFGLLPQYRGADAIFWSIKNREQFGGISVHKMDADYDTGDILHLEKLALLPTDTYGMHAAKLANTNVEVLQKILPLLLSGKVSASVQSNADAHYYSKPQLKNIAIDWQKQMADEIVALVNACNPWNKGAYTMYNGMPLRITEAAVVINSEANSVALGEIIEINNTGIQVQCLNSTLNIKVVTVEEGIYTGYSFAQYCGIKKGLKFNNLQV